MYNFDNKVVAITGATGLIGSNLVNRLLKYNNIKVIAIGRNLSRLENVFEIEKSSDNLILMEQDISLPYKIGEPVDFVFHAAGPISGNIIKNSPVDVIMPNILGTLNTLDLIEQQKHLYDKKTKLLVFSSATVYANLKKEDIVVNEVETSIADSLDADNAPYSESKRMVEVIAKAYAKQKNIDVSIVRFSYVYGYSKNKPNTAFYEFIKRAISGEDIVLNNSDLPRRDNIYVADAVDGLLTVACNGENGQSYNVSTNKEKHNFAAVDEMAKVIVDVVNGIKGTDVKIKYNKEILDNVKRKPGIILSNDKLHSLDWNVQTSLEDGIRKTIEIYLNE